MTKRQRKVYACEWLSAFMSPGGPDYYLDAGRVWGCCQVRVACGVVWQYGPIIVWAHAAPWGDSV